MTRPQAPRIAIVGTGMIAAVHVRAARDAGAQIIGVLGSSPDKSLACAQQWDIGVGFGSLDDLLAARPDVVQICTPNATHFDYALTAIAAGVHVVCEKPLALNAEDAQTLTTAADTAGVTATVPFVYRYHPLVRELRNRREAGEFGEILLVHGSYLQDWLHDSGASSWRIDAGLGGASRAFADIGSHWCDLAEFVSGEKFTHVNASTSIAYESRPRSGAPSYAESERNRPLVPVTTEDSAIATFRTANGRIANCVISQTSAGRKNRLWIEIDGSSASAVFDQENPESVWIGRPTHATTLQRGASPSSADHARLNRVPSGHPQGYPDAFSAFLADTYAATRGANRDGLPTFADGLRASKIIDAVLESARTSTWQAISA